MSKVGFVLDGIGHLPPCNVQNTLKNAVKDDFECYFGYRINKIRGICPINKIFYSKNK